MAVLIVPIFGFINSFLRIIFDPVSYNPTQGFSPGMFGLLLSVGFAIITIINFSKISKNNERSVVSWIGFITAVIVVGFWVLMIIGELIYPH